MVRVAEQWNPRQALLRSLITMPDKFKEAMSLVLELHSMVHTSEMSGINESTFEDQLWDGLQEEAFRTMPTIKDVTIAWNIWHITRIEDITSNILIAKDVQVINSGGWVEKIKTAVTDTGNAMTDEEIIDLSNAIDMAELRNYRIAVGKKTREILAGLKHEDLKKKVSEDSVKRILLEGGVLDKEGSKWLLDFWGRKNIAGILLMPITRHQMGHINDSLKLKEKMHKKLRK